MASTVSNQMARESRNVAAIWLEFPAVSPHRERTGTQRVPLCARNAIRVGGMTQRRWLELIARAGYAARGVVFSIVGVFVALAAVGARSRLYGIAEAAYRRITPPNIVDRK